MTNSSIWAATSRAPAAGTMRLPVDTGASSSPGYLQVADVAGPIVYTANGVDDTAALTTLFATSGSYLLKGTIITGNIALNGKNLTIDFDEGAVLNPNGTINQIWSFTNCNLIFKRLNVDGLQISQNAIFMNGGTLKFDSAVFTNMGMPVTVSTDVVAGFYLQSVTDINGGYFKATNFNSVGTGAFGATTGCVRGMILISCGAYDVKFYEYDATNCDGEQIDMFYANIGNTGGVLHHFKGRYNGNVRRCLKYQTGYNEVVFADIQKASDFAAVSGSTNIGAKNLNCIDWAGSGAGQLNILGGYVDASGYAAGIVQSVAGAGVITASNGLFMLGSTLQGIRNNPQTGSPETIDTVGFGTLAGSTCPGSGIDGATIQNFYRTIYLQSDFSYVRNCLFIDPVHLFALGNVNGTTQTNSIIFDRNTIETVTSGYMNATRFIIVENVLNATIRNNQMIANGNASYASRFIDFAVAGATGTAYGNIVPAGQTEVNVGSATVVAATGSGAPVFGTSPTLATAVLGSSTATTQSAGDASTKVATTAYVNSAVNNIVINTQSNDYTLALTDNGGFVDMTKGTATALTIPANGTIAFPVGAQVTIRQGGAGQVTVGITSDTLNSPMATLKTRAQYSQFVITKMASTTWTITGDAATS